MEMRRRVVVVIHRDDDAEEPGQFRHNGLRSKAQAKDGSAGWS
jgi:hypothetical protein